MTTEKDLKKKTLVVYSGGMDSTALLLSMIAEEGKAQVGAVNFAYGSKHNMLERAAAEKITERLGIPLLKVDLPFIQHTFKSALLLGQGQIPQGHYTAESMAATVVPLRNGIMLSIAAGIAESHGYTRIAIANHAGDHAIYPDCRDEFIIAMRAAIRTGSDGKVDLYAPFTLKTKADICKIGTEVNFSIMANSWSCYDPDAYGFSHTSAAKHCGKCGTCVERIEAFMLAEAVDHTNYADTSFAKRVLREKKEAE